VTRVGTKSALFFDHNACLKLFLQDIGLVGRPMSGQDTLGRRVSLTLFNIRTIFAFFNNLFEQVAVKSCRESSMRFVRGSSSKYYGEVGIGCSDMSRATTGTHLIEGGNRSEENNGSGCQKKEED
jgi:hypothetical protein